MTEQYYGGKHEKEEEKGEKEHEKEYEKEHEKSWDEKWRRDPIAAAVWAIILIWAGVVLLVDNLDIVVRLEWFDAWGVILAGASLIVLAGVVIRLLVPSYRGPVTGSVILSVVLLGFGLSVLLQTNLVWALVLIAIGAIMLLRGLGRGR
jgi:hypothetical protein